MFSSFFGAICGGLCVANVHSPVVEIVDVEQQEDSNSISMLSEDVMSKQIVSFLKFREVVRLDTALANRKLRNFFHACLGGSVLNGVVDFRHIEWCRVRKCSANILRVTSDLNDDSHFIDVSRFETLSVGATAKVAEGALHQVLSNGKDFKTLDLRSFYTMHLQHVLLLPFDSSLLEINAEGNDFLWENVLIELVKRCPILRVINASRCLQYTKSLPLALAEHCPHLREVLLTTFEKSHGIDPEQPNISGYTELFQRCRQLQVVHCSGDITIRNMQTLADSCRGLTSVRLRGVYFFHWDEEDTARIDSALAALAQNNTQLHSLELSTFRRLSDVSLLAVAHFLPDLHTFVLEHCQASLSGLAEIRTHCTKLMRFEVYDYQRYLTIEAQPNYFNYMHMSIITTLRIDAARLSDEHLVTIAQSNPNIRTLSITSVSNAQNAATLTHSAICASLSYLHNLEEFFMNTYATVNYPIASKMQQEDALLFNLIQHCPKLTALDVSSHTHLSNTALSDLSQLPLLRKFHARWCTNLLDSGLTAIAEGCPLLQDLELTHCTRISHIGINALAHNCRRLTSVDLSHCGNVTNCAVQDLIRHARCLQTLDVAFIPQLTFAAVAELPQYCQCMRELRLYTNRFGLPRKPFLLDCYASYRRNRHYFDVVFGWLEEMRLAFSLLD